MGKIMHNSVLADCNYSFGLNTINKTNFYETGHDRLILEDALENQMVNIEQLANFNGQPYVRVTNNSSWKIVLFKKNEMTGRKFDSVLKLTLVLQHNESVDIPAFFISSTYFYDGGMDSIQKYLHVFKALDNQVGVVYRKNGKVVGERAGHFPLRVEVDYRKFSINAVSSYNKFH